MPSKSGYMISFGDGASVGSSELCADVVDISKRSTRRRRDAHKIRQRLHRSSPAAMSSPSSASERSIPLVWTRAQLKSPRVARREGPPKKNSYDIFNSPYSPQHSEQESTVTCESSIHSVRRGSEIETSYQPTPSPLSSPEAVRMTRTKRKTRTGVSPETKECPPIPLEEDNMIAFFPRLQPRASQQGKDNNFDRILASRSMSENSEEASFSKRDPLDKYLSLEEKSDSFKKHHHSKRAHKELQSTTKRRVSVGSGTRTKAVEGNSQPRTHFEEPKKPSVQDLDDRLLLSDSIIQGAARVAFEKALQSHSGELSLEPSALSIKSGLTTPTSSPRKNLQQVVFPLESHQTCLQSSTLRTEKPRGSGAPSVDDGTVEKKSTLERLRTKSAMKSQINQLEKVSPGDESSQSSMQTTILKEVTRMRKKDRSAFYLRKAQSPRSLMTRTDTSGKRLLKRDSPGLSCSHPKQAPKSALKQRRNNDFETRSLGGVSWTSNEVSFYDDVGLIKSSIPSTEGDHSAGEFVLKSSGSSDLESTLGSLPSNLDLVSSGHKETESISNILSLDSLRLFEQHLDSNLSAEETRQKLESVQDEVCFLRRTLKTKNEEIRRQQTLIEAQEQDIAVLKMERDLMKADLFSVQQQLQGHKEKAGCVNHFDSAKEAAVANCESSLRFLYAAVDGWSETFHYKFQCGSSSEE